MGINPESLPVNIRNRIKQGKQRVPSGDVKSVNSIEFPFLMPGLNGNDGLIRTHWSGRKRLRNDLIWIIKESLLTPHAGIVKIIYERHEVRPTDWDNHCASFKLIGDALQDCGIITDDSPAVIKEFVPRKKKVKHYADVKTIIHIEDICE